MFDHIGIRVSDLGASKLFYRRALEPLGLRLGSEFEGGAGFGPEGAPGLWLHADEAAPRGAHIAFTAASREAVDRFHAAALSAGGRDNGGLGLRTDYGASYYAAFVLDPDGHNIEAVCTAEAG